MFSRYNRDPLWDDFFGPARPLRQRFPAQRHRNSPSQSTDQQRHPRSGPSDPFEPSELQRSEQPTRRDQLRKPPSQRSGDGPVRISRKAPARWSDAPTVLGDTHDSDDVLDDPFDKMDKLEVEGQDHTNLKSRDISNRRARDNLRNNAVDADTDIDTASDQTTALQSELERLRQQRVELQEKLQGQLQEVERIKERMNREFDTEKLRLRGELVGAFLPVLDNLNRSVRAAKDSPDRGLLEGIEVVRDQFTQVLNGYGLQPFDSLGKDFDPTVHEAVATLPVTDADMHHKVIQEFEQGCYHDDKLLRPARVAVGKFE